MIGLWRSPQVAAGQFDAKTVGHPEVFRNPHRLLPYN
jgi:hypothetical protein